MKRRIALSANHMDDQVRSTSINILKDAKGEPPLARQGGARRHHCGGMRRDVERSIIVRQFGISHVGKLGFAVLDQGRVAIVYALAPDAE
jgi:hypothetical protein